LKRQHVKNQASLIKLEGDGLTSEKARAYAFFLLKFRLRSEQELLQRLKKKGFSGDLSQSTVNFLKNKEFIDDRLFAKVWVGNRLKRPFGLKKIRQELEQKGLTNEIIQDALSAVKADYCETQLVSQLAQQRFARQVGVDKQKAKARVYAYLLRRGFSPDIVSQIVKQL
jgi:regulatory protein